MNTPRGLRTTTITMTQAQLATAGLACAKLMNELENGGTLRHDLPVDQVMDKLRDVCTIMGLAVESTLSEDERKEVHELAAQLRAMDDTTGDVQ